MSKRKMSKTSQKVEPSSAIINDDSNEIIKIYEPELSQEFIVKLFCSVWSPRKSKKGHMFDAYTDRLELARIVCSTAINDYHTKDRIFQLLQIAEPAVSRTSCYLNYLKYRNGDQWVTHEVVRFIHDTWGIFLEFAFKVAKLLLHSYIGIPLYPNHAIQNPRLYYSQYQRHLKKEKYCAEYSNYSAQSIVAAITERIIPETKKIYTKHKAEWDSTIFPDQFEEDMEEFNSFYERLEKQREFYNNYFICEHLNFFSCVTGFLDDVQKRFSEDFKAECVHIGLTKLSAYKATFSIQSVKFPDIYGRVTKTVDDSSIEDDDDLTYEGFKKWLMNKTDMHAKDTLRINDESAATFYPPDSSQKKKPSRSLSLLANAAEQIKQQEMEIVDEVPEIKRVEGVNTEEAKKVSAPETDLLEEDCKLNGRQKKEKKSILALDVDSDDGSGSSPTLISTLLNLSNAENDNAVLGSDENFLQEDMISEEPRGTTKRLRLMKLTDMICDCDEENQISMYDVQQDTKCEKEENKKEKNNNDEEDIEEQQTSSNDDDIMIEEDTSIDEEIVEEEVDAAIDENLQTLQNNELVKVALSNIATVVVQGVVNRLREKQYLQDYAQNLMDATTSILKDLDKSRVQGVLRKVIIGLFDQLCK
jgi:hypothetical protein